MSVHQSKTATKTVQVSRSARIITVNKGLQSSVAIFADTATEAISVISVQTEDLSWTFEDREGGPVKVIGRGYIEDTGRPMIPGYELVTLYLRFETDAFHVYETLRQQGIGNFAVT